MQSLRCAIKASSLSIAALLFSLASSVHAAAPQSLAEAWNQLCEIQAPAFASLTEAEGAFWAILYEETPPKSDARRKFVAEHEKMREERNNYTFEKQKKLRADLVEKNWPPERARLLSQVLLILDKNSQLLARTNPGLTALGYERRLVEACQKIGYQSME